MVNLIDNEYLETAARVDDYSLDTLHKNMMRHPRIGDVRGIGLMIAVEFVEDRTNKVSYEKLPDRIIEMVFECVLILPGCGKTTIHFAPPLSVSKPEVDEALTIFEESVSLAEKDDR